MKNATMVSDWEHSGAHWIISLPIALEIPQFE